MRFSLVLAALLCFTTWMSVGHAPIVPVASCCLGWSNLKGVPLNRILDYTIQSDGVCPIKAVVFQTTRGLGISSDPNSDRAEKAILKVDEEKEKALQEKGQNEEGLTSDITPTVSTTAVAFQTTRGLGISSDPNSDRAEKAILKVDEEKEKALQEKGQNEEGLTSDITPTVSTTAVAFQTTRGVRISSDPNSEKNAILKVDEEEKKALQEKGQNEEESTSDITPAVCTKPKKTPQKKGRFGTHSNVRDSDGHWTPPILILIEEVKIYFKLMHAWKSLCVQVCNTDMEGDARGRSPGKGGRGKENVREESQDKSKLPQSANFTLSIWTYPAILHE
ncbi:uncharacterized protein LOC141777033 isoform X2 [Sebastes fasciatus]|uniref:uncharacterized protein LOC141777033 isoform X2 n=1 Tax=Sebastes fasciatus TaxID=394691 RepID=UPI003D9E3529